MADTVDISLCILWENELRAAAKALQALEVAKDAEYSTRAVDALNACMVALHSLTDEKHVVLIGADALRKNIAAVEKNSK